MDAPYRSTNVFVHVGEVLRQGLTSLRYRCSAERRGRQHHQDGSNICSYNDRGRLDAVTNVGGTVSYS